MRRGTAAVSTSPTGAAAAAMALALLLLLPSSTQAVQHFKGLTDLAHMAAVGITDEEGTVLRSTLLGFANRHCADRQYDLGFPFDYIDLPNAVFELGEVLVEDPPNELMAFFGVAPEDCGGAFVHLAPGSKLEDKGRMLRPGSQGELETWFWEPHRVTDHAILNDLGAGRTVAVYWEARESQRERRIMQLAPGERMRHGTFLGHTLVFREVPAEGGGAERLLARAVITEARAAKEGIILSALLAEEKGNTEDLQLDEHAFKVWRGRASTNMARLRQNERQPPTVIEFTDVGFKKMKIPKNLYQRLLDFNLANERHRIQEGWHEDDLHVNFYDVMTTVVHLDNPTRQAVFDTMKPILESWIGGHEPLEPTSTYGIRRYYHDSRLRDHVDIGETHIVSAILNLGQHGLDKAWPLQILDHEGRRHFIEMAPGDAVLYESARAIHGRTQPLAATHGHYDNVFTHFRPVSWRDGPPDPREHEMARHEREDGHDGEEGWVAYDEGVEMEDGRADAMFDVAEDVVEDEMLGGGGVMEEM